MRLHTCGCACACTRAHAHVPAHVRTQTLRFEKLTAHEMHCLLSKHGLAKYNDAHHIPNLIFDVIRHTTSHVLARLIIEPNAQAPLRNGQAKARST